MKYQIYFLVICLSIFSAQTYVFITTTMDIYLAPFEQSESVYAIVHKALWHIWSGMLIWPALLFAVLITLIVKSMKEATD